jgi:SPP1 family predicted phage head-tail adaptor
MKAIKSFLNNTFAVYRNLRTADGQGGYVTALTYIGDIAGRLRPASANERQAADQSNVKLTHVLYCEADADIQRGDTVVGAGVELRIVAVREPSYARHHYEVDCVQIVREPAEVNS